MKNLNYLMHPILYQIYKISLNIFKKTHEIVTGNPSIKCTFYLTNKILFKIKTGYYIELLAPETMKLLGCTKCTWMYLCLI